MRKTALLLCVLALLALAVADTGFVKGTLVDVVKPNGRQDTRMQVSVRVGDLVYTGETRSGAMREFVIGEPLDVRLTDKYFYLKRSNGKEIKLKIFKRARATPTGSGAAAAVPQ